MRLAALFGGLRVGRSITLDVKRDETGRAFVVTDGRLTFAQRESVQREWKRADQMHAKTITIPA